MLEATWSTSVCTSQDRAVFLQMSVSVAGSPAKATTTASTTQARPTGVFPYLELRSPAERPRTHACYAYPSPRQLQTDVVARTQRSLRRPRASPPPLLRTILPSPGLRVVAGPISPASAGLISAWRPSSSLHTRISAVRVSDAASSTTVTTSVLPLASVLLPLPEVPCTQPLAVHLEQLLSPSPRLLLFPFFLEGVGLLSCLVGLGLGDLLQQGVLSRSRGR